jgi:hypothetical protein
MPFRDAQRAYDDAIVRRGCHWSARQLAFSVIALCTADPHSAAHVDDMSAVAARYTCAALDALPAVPDSDNDSDSDAIVHDTHDTLLCFLVRSLLALRCPSHAVPADGAIRQQLGYTHLAHADAFSQGALRVFDELRRRAAASVAPARQTCLDGMSMRLL